MRRRTVIGVVLVASIGFAGWLEWRQGQADLIKGPASVVDGDSIRVSGQSIRLQGIDAPELKQRCRNDDPCGHYAKSLLADATRDLLVTCTRLTTDRYRRVVARCVTETGEDLADLVARAGWAVIDDRFPSRYHAAVDDARRQNIGVHGRGGIQAPAGFRQDERDIPKDGILQKIRRLLAN